jgi:pimeloyl-ACP methyl ester carboxylesterase
LVLAALRLQESPLTLVETAFRTLPDRYLGAPEGFDATYHVRLADLGHTFEVRCTAAVARVRKGISSRPPDVVIGTDAETWLALRNGELSGLEAFLERRLYARGQIDLAVRFESLFRLPDGRDPLLELRDVPIGRGRTISTLSLGQGPDVLLLHGLGAAKTSMFELAAHLARDGYRVHALDLPGFGSSSKPSTASYSAQWLAECVLELMDELGIDTAHLVGNSLGGRVALELALGHPGRVRSVAALCPAVAFIKRGLHPLVRLVRPELGLLPHRFRRALVQSQLSSMFADRDQLDPSVADLVVDEFQRTYASAGARFAFYAAARNIYLDRPFGRHGFYPRLAELEPPSLFVWGRQDRLIPPAFARYVARSLASAEQVVLDRCGHVPQVEQAGATAQLVAGLLTRAEALGTRDRAGASAA